MGLACPVDILVRMAAFSALPRGIAGVALLIRFVGRQYSVLDPAEPQGLLVRLSFHFSAAQRLSDAPAALLRTWPCFLRHLATA